MSGRAQYLVALYVLRDRRDPPHGTGDVAELLDRSPAAVTEMFQRLEDDGLVTYEPYYGVALTDAGRERAGRLHDTYAAISGFFRDVLELDSRQTETIQLAAVLEPDVAERLASELPDETQTDGLETGRPASSPGEFSERG